MKGGKREGAGRPSMDMKLITFRLYSEDIELIKDTAREVGVSRAYVIHEMIETYKMVASGEYVRIPQED